MSTDAQLAAFSSHNFEADERWKEYFNNIMFPPGKENDPATIRRYKQKFFKNQVDPDFEVEPLAAGPRPVPPASSDSSEGATRRRVRFEEAPGRGSGEPPGTRPGPWSGSGARASRPGSSLLNVDGDTAKFLGNAWVVVMAVVALFPFTPRPLMVRCFRLALSGALVTSIFSMIHRCGTPRAFRWDSIKAWLQTCVQGEELLTLLHCAIFLPALHPATVAVLPVAARLGPPIADYLRQNFSRAALYRSYLEQHCVWVSNNRASITLFAANMEVMLGFLVIFYMITPQRSLLQTVFYWQLLKLKYHSFATSWAHRQIWAQLGSKVEPFLQQYIPFTLPLLGFAKTWFNSIGQ